MAAGGGQHGTGRIDVRHTIAPLRHRPGQVDAQPADLADAGDAGVQRGAQVGPLPRAERSAAGLQRQPAEVRGGRCPMRWVWQSHMPGITVVRPDGLVGRPGAALGGRSCVGDRVAVDEAAPRPGTGSPRPGISWVASMRIMGFSAWGLGGRPPSHIAHYLDGRRPARSIMDDRLRAPGRRQVRTNLPYFHRQYLRVCCREYGSCAIQGHTTVRQPGAGIWALGRQGHRGEEA